jgi:hypothetical protein
MHSLCARAGAEDWGIHIHCLGDNGKAFAGAVFNAAPSGGCGPGYREVIAETPGFALGKATEILSDFKRSALKPLDHDATERCAAYYLDAGAVLRQTGLRITATTRC